MERYLITDLNRYIVPVYCDYRSPHNAIHTTNSYTLEPGVLFHPFLRFCSFNNVTCDHLNRINNDAVSDISSRSECNVDERRLRSVSEILLHQRL